MTKQKKNNIYTRIVTIFLIFTILAIFVILHFALAKVTIKIYKQASNKELNGLIEVQSENDFALSPEAILGKIITVENELTVTVPSSQEMVSNTKAGGYVTIYNNYYQDQILVKTTRLLTPTNKLFRITETVTVPKGSSISVWAEADQEGKEYITEATTFIIPGLWIGLQDKIYAETKEGMKLKNIPQYLVKEEDLDKAFAKLKAQATIQALETINNSLNKNLWLDEKRLKLNFETLEVTPLNTVAEEVILKQKIKAQGLVFSLPDLLKKTKDKFRAELEDDQILQEFNDNSFRYNILEIYTEKEGALIEVKIEALLTSQEHLWNINKDDLRGLTKKNIKEYLKQYNIENSEINFFPFWVKRVPQLKDHIIIE